MPFAPTISGSNRDASLDTTSRLKVSSVAVSAASSRAMRSGRDRARRSVAEIGAPNAQKASGPRSSQNAYSSARGTNTAFGATSGRRPTPAFSPSGRWRTSLKRPCAVIHMIRFGRLSTAREAWRNCAAPRRDSKSTANAPSRRNTPYRASIRASKGAKLSRSGHRASAIRMMVTASHQEGWLQ